MVSASPRELTWRECDDIFADLYAAGLEPIVVGGQAVNLWIDYYSKEGACLAVPIASKDIDVVGDVELAAECALALKARCRRVNRVREAVPINAIVFVGDEKDGLKIDFQDGSDPNPPKEIEVHAVPLPTEWGKVRVMHPLHCVKSRIYNVLEIRHKGKLKYDNTHGRAQMHAAMRVFRHFTEELVAIDDGPRKVLKLYEDLFKFAKGPLGTKLWDSKRIDVFDCIQPLTTLPKEFQETRYPQMRKSLNREKAGAIRRVSWGVWDKTPPTPK